MSPQEARMEGIAIVRKWIDDGKPTVNTILHQAVFESERLLDQLRSAFERSCNTVERSRVLHAQLDRCWTNRSGRSLPVNANGTNEAGW
jgi:hypothetical protein